MRTSRFYSLPPYWRSNSTSLRPLDATTCNGVSPLIVRGIDLGLVGQQQLHNVLVALIRRKVQGRKAALGLAIDSGEALDTGMSMGRSSSRTKK